MCGSIPTGLADSTEDLTNTKFIFIDSDINPILCIGESKEERESDQTFDVIDKQIRSVLDSDILSKDVGLLIAYEPIWAIGTGLTATPEMANEVHSFIHSILTEMTPMSIPIIYGGSMKESNAKELKTLNF